MPRIANIDGCQLVLGGDSTSLTRSPLCTRAYTTTLSEYEDEGLNRHPCTHPIAEPFGEGMLLAPLDPCEHCKHHQENGPDVSEESEEDQQHPQESDEEAERWQALWTQHNRREEPEHRVYRRLVLSVPDPAVYIQLRPREEQRQQLTVERDGRPEHGTETLHYTRYVQLNHPPKYPRWHHARLRDLDIDPRSVITRQAIVLAHLHWSMGLDGDRVSFTVRCPERRSYQYYDPASETGPTTTTPMDPNDRVSDPADLWVTNLGHAHRIENFDDSFVDEAWLAFCRDFDDDDDLWSCPWPRPLGRRRRRRGDTCRDDWDLFRAQYLATAREIRTARGDEDVNDGVPGDFIFKVEDTYAFRQVPDDEDGVAPPYPESDFLSDDCEEDEVLSDV